MRLSANSSPLWLLPAERPIGRAGFALAGDRRLSRHSEFTCDIELAKLFTVRRMPNSHGVGEWDVKKLRYLLNQGTIQYGCSLRLPRERHRRESDDADDGGNHHDRHVEITTPPLPRARISRVWFHKMLHSRPIDPVRGS